MELACVFRLSQCPQLLYLIPEGLRNSEIRAQCGLPDVEHPVVLIAGNCSLRLRSY